jgi:hypothetical protein
MTGRSQLKEVMPAVPDELSFECTFARCRHQHIRIAGALVNGVLNVP